MVQRVVFRHLICHLAGENYLYVYIMKHLSKASTAGTIKCWIVSGPVSLRATLAFRETITKGTYFPQIQHIMIL